MTYEEHRVQRMREAAVEKHFCKAIRRLKGYAFKWLCPQFIGVPDRIVLLPGARIFFAEIKAPGENLRPRQERVKYLLESLGFTYYVIDSTDVADEVVSRWI